MMRLLLNSEVASLGEPHRRIARDEVLRADRGDLERG